MLVSNPGDRACDYRYTIYKHINSLMLSNNTMPNYVHRFIWYVYYLSVTIFVRQILRLFTEYILKILHYLSNVLYIYCLL